MCNVKIFLLKGERGNVFEFFFLGGGALVVLLSVVLSAALPSPFTRSFLKESSLMKYGSTKKAEEKNNGPTIERGGDTGAEQTE